MDNKQRVREVMDSMAQGQVAPLLEAMAEDVTWRWMGVNQWSRTFAGKKSIVDTLFGGATESLGPSSSTEVHRLHADGDHVVVEHSGRNELPDGLTTTTAGSFGSRTV
jgi:ketosteroid isomerase-like protein